MSLFRNLPAVGMDGHGSEKELGFIEVGFEKLRSMSVSTHNEAKYFTIATTSFVVGLFALLLFWTPYLAFTLETIAIILGVVGIYEARHKHHHGFFLSLYALILASIALLSTIVSLLINSGTINLF